MNIAMTRLPSLTRSRALSAPSYAHESVTPKKRGKIFLCGFCCHVYCFLSSNSTATAIAMIMPIVEPSTYVSVIGAGGGVGVGVASGAASTPFFESTYQHSKNENSPVITLLYITNRSTIVFQNHNYSTPKTQLGYALFAR
jgi:hypothetical protein